jgi:hypothetical protein
MELSNILQILGSMFSLNPHSVFDRIKSDSIFWLDFIEIIKDLSKNKMDNDEFIYYNDETVSEFFEIAKKQWTPQFDKAVASPFEFLRRSVQDLITFQGETPRVNFRMMANWQNLTKQMGEDIFVSAYYANNSILHGREPLHFQWNYILYSNFDRLNSIIKESGLYENHYHLWGSAPYVDLSWISLMNQPFGRSHGFKNMIKRSALTASGIATLNTYKQTSIYLLTQIAAYIRLLLFETCCLEIDTSNLNLMQLIRIIKETIACDFMINNNNLSEKINAYRFMSQYKYSGKTVDYAISQYFYNNQLSNCALSGERHLYYCCLKYIFQNKPKYYSVYISFYLYLLIRNYFAGQFFQRNKKYGFDNFEKYQQIKNDIITGTHYEKIALMMAVNENISENSLKKLEVRVTPKNTITDLKNSLEYIEKYNNKENSISKDQTTLDSIINNEILKKHPTTEPPDNQRFFYTIHFIKHKYSDWGINEKYFQMRDSKLRRLLKNQALSILLLRERNDPLAYRIGGVDASSSEINCRPEVFSQVFRMLSDPINKSDLSVFDIKPLTMPNLKKTYHVGEDFYDLADGLRAIDEAIWFLDLKYGDRIGHGVALGINPEKYYSKRKEIAMPVQNILDNYAWLYYCISRFSLNVKASYISEINFQFNKYFNKVFCTNEKQGHFNCDLLDYIDAWKLRGDNPIAYVNQDFEKEKANNLNPFLQWAKYDFRFAEAYRNINKSTYMLYHLYHFDNSVKNKARKSELIYISNEYIDVVSQIQQYMRNFVLESGVAVESCPSSNFSISKLNNFQESPVLNLFPIEETEGNPRLNTSINTDDQGVFYTSLVKEYTLLTNLMCNIRTDNGLRKYSDDKILDWIQKLMKNGKEQCFIK